jgi:diguanylate cyclase (GGDEF)-like protein
MRSVTDNDARADGPRSSVSCAALFVLALAVALPATARAAAAAPLIGAPPVARFTPDVQYYPQHFSIAQDAAGLVYFGGSDGLLLFDGARWLSMPLPNHDLVRSLAWDGGERVYVGGYGVFGWYERDPTGAVVYRDLTPRALELAGGDFADVWELFVLPEGVLFRALKHVFLFDPKTGAMRHWAHPGRFGTAYRDADGLVLQWRGEGFKRLVGERWTLVPGGDAPGFRDLVFFVLPLPDGARLANARSGGWLVLRDGKAGPAAVPRDLPAAARVSFGMALADGALALAGDDGVVYVWEPRDDVVHRVRVGDERVNDLVLARDGGMLVAAYSAIHRIEWPARWSAVGAEVGLRGAIRGAAEWRGETIALTGAGASALRRDADGELRAVRLPWTDHEAWALLALDPTRALFAESYALLEVGAAGAHKVSDDLLYPRVLQRSRFDHELVLIGTEHGLALARRGAGGWRVVANRTQADAPNVREIVELAPGELVLGTQRGGVMRARLDAAGAAVVALAAVAGGPPLGPTGELHLARLPEGAVIVATEAGLYRMEGERFVPDAVGGLAAMREPGALLALDVAPDGTAWAWSRYELLRRPAGGAWQREDVSAVRRGVLEDLSFGTGGELTITTTNALLFQHPRVAPGLRPPPPRVALRGVTQIGADGAHRALALDGRAPVLRADDDSTIEFRFALPELRRAGSARYRARLLGYEAEFSEWATAAQHAYRGLAPGRYRFEVEARDADGAVSVAQPFEFTIAPRWYATAWARTLWALLAFALTFAATLGVVGWRTRRLASDKLALETMVEARTRELADANRKLDTIAHLDGLTGIPNRRKLDEYLEQVWALCAERERPLAVLAIDVDRFKDYNDRHGHLAGDALLKRLAPILTRNLRRTEDLAARYGGEEFLVVLPGADAEVAREVGEALREKVGTSSIGATISIGVAAETPRSGRAVTELVALADAALYRAKEAGRNRVVVSGA